MSKQIFKPPMFSADFTKMQEKPVKIDIILSPIRELEICSFNHIHTS